MEAKAETRGSENITLLLLASAVGFAFFDRMSINFLFPYIMQEFSLSQTQLGMLSSSLALTISFSGIFLSPLVQKVGRKHFVVLIVLLLGVGSLVQAFTVSFGMLLVMRLLMGLTEGLFVPVCQSLMSDASSESRRGLNMGIVQGTSVALIASTLSPVLLVYLADNFGWRVGYYVLFVPCLILGLMMIRYLSKDPRVPETTVSQEKKSKLSMVELLKKPNIFLCFIISTGILAWYLILAAFIPSYLTSELGKGLDTTQMGLVAIGLGIGGAIWGLLVPAVSDRIGRKKAILLFSFFSCLSPLGLCFYQVFQCYLCYVLLYFMQVKG